MADAFEVKREDVLAMFTAMGYGTASKWSTKRMEQKLNKLVDTVEDGFVIDSQPEQVTLDGIRAALKEGKVISIEKPPVKEPTKRKLSKEEIREKKASTSTEETPKEKKAPKKAKEEKKEKAPKEDKSEKRGRKGPGIIKTIIEILSKDRPVTKEQILAKLVKKFPDRKAESMAMTINTQVPNRLRSNGFEVEKMDDKFTIVTEANK